jgi:hypothetical protein
MSKLLDISLGRSNIAPLALVTAFFGVAKMDCPSCLQRGPFGRQFFFPPPAASVTFSPTDRGLGYSDAIAPLTPERAMLGTADYATTRVVWRGRSAS